jgi:sugar phosphate isomerase/epimerase
MRNLLVLLTILICLTPQVKGQPKVKEPTSADRLGWQLAVHSYTFRKFTISEAIEKTSALGMTYFSISGSVNWDGKQRNTIDLSETELVTLQKKLRAAGIVRMVNMGVVRLPANEAESRKVFEFAKRAGIDVLVSEPAEAALDTVEKLAKEYTIKVALHNHPKPSHYWNPDTVLQAIKGRSPLLGACADTGHWIRSGLDPVEALKKLEGRVLSLHFKDLVKNDGKGFHDVPWGTGVGRCKDVMAELKRQRFRGAFCVEYEHNWENSFPEIAECAKFFNATCADLVK